MAVPFQDRAPPATQSPRLARSTAQHERHGTDPHTPDGTAARHSTLAHLSLRYVKLVFYHDKRFHKLR
eukprot:8141832-Pyramimonas_sp.AAC.1